MAESIAQLRNRRIKAIKLQYLRYEDKIQDPKIGFRIPILDPGFFKIFKSSLARKFLDPGSWILSWILDPKIGSRILIWILNIFILKTLQNNSIKLKCSQMQLAHKSFHPYTGRQHH